jgi:hypothetical protein
MAAVAVLAGCQADGLTEVLVTIDAQPTVRELSATLHVRVYDHDRQLVLDEQLAFGDDTSAVVVPLVPRDGDADRTFLVEARTLDRGGAPVATARAEGRYVAGEVRELTVCMTDVCRDESCGTIDDCLASSCLTCIASSSGDPRSCGAAAATTSIRGAGPVGCPPPRCVPTEPAGDPERVCDDGVDDDCDTLVDCSDPDCLGIDCSEGLGSGEVCDAMGECTCPTTESDAASCQDGVSNDCDALVDCLDPDCTGVRCDAATGLCIGGSCDECPGGEIAGEGSTGGMATCTDEEDNDCDTLIDGEDPDCCRFFGGQPCGNDERKRCCSGSCVRIDQHPNCGSCGAQCQRRGSDGMLRECHRITSAPSDGPPRFACRCQMIGSSANCPRNQICQTRRNQTLCQCIENEDCGAAQSCRREGIDDHNYCVP